MSRPSPWFAAKRYGYGSGLPVAWQGWLVYAVYLILCCGGAFVLPHTLRNPALATALVFAIVLVATIVLFFICKAKTDGGWRWRWGRED